MEVRRAGAGAADKEAAKKAALGEVKEVARREAVAQAASVAVEAVIQGVDQMAGVERVVADWAKACTAEGMMEPVVEVTEKQVAVGTDSVKAVAGLEVRPEGSRAGWWEAVKAVLKEVAWVALTAEEKWAGIEEAATVVAQVESGEVGMVVPLVALMEAAASWEVALAAAARLAISLAASLVARAEA